MNALAYGESWTPMRTLGLALRAKYRQDTSASEPEFDCSVEANHDESPYHSISYVSLWEGIFRHVSIGEIKA